MNFIKKVQNKIPEKEIYLHQEHILQENFESFCNILPLLKKKFNQNPKKK